MKALGNNNSFAHPPSQPELPVRPRTAHRSRPVLRTVRHIRPFRLGYKHHTTTDTLVMLRVKINTRLRLFHKYFLRHVGSNSDRKISRQFFCCCEVLLPGQDVVLLLLSVQQRITNQRQRSILHLLCRSV